MILFEKEKKTGFLTEEELRQGVVSGLEKFGPPHRILVVPPDITRIHSMAGTLTRVLYECNPGAVKAVLPAVGTHHPMSEQERALMFGRMPSGLFLEHCWRSDCTMLGEIGADFVYQVSEGSVSYPIPVEVNRLLLSPEYDCIFSIGQVVPHEVAGFAGHNKNIFVGLGGAENINKSHFLGAAFGMERIMGRADTPTRAVFDYAVGHFLASLPLVHCLTVMDSDGSGAVRPRGLYIGTGREIFVRAAALSQQLNVALVEKPFDTVVVFLDPVEYRSFWLGNKSIYRTRMAIADKGKLVVLAPGVETFGEDTAIDRLIRKYGYRGMRATMRLLEDGASDLTENLGAAAHLIHGSSEARFSITYCTEKLTRQEVESVGFHFAPLNDMLKSYDPKKLRQGVNTLPNGEKVFYVSNPGAGLWACKEKFVRQR